MLILVKDVITADYSIIVSVHGAHNDYVVKAAQGCIPVFLEKASDVPSEHIEKAKRCKLFYAINQVLLLHQGPILDFTLAMDASDWDASDFCVEMDQIITHLSRNNTLKKLNLDLSLGSTLPLSLFSLHELTHLYLRDCGIYHELTFSGFGSLTTLYLDNVIIEQETLLYLLSSCPLLTHLSLHFERDFIFGNDDSTIIELFESVPLIEHLSVYMWVIEVISRDTD